MTSTDFVVARDDLHQCKLINTNTPDADVLPPDALLVKVDRFAFTANNITYAVLGDELKYWQLFPAARGFGNIPVWGFGEVIASKHPNVAVGERLFGYFPMATHLVIEAADVSKRGLRDGAAHRQGVAPVYNAYARVSGDPAYAGGKATIRPCCGRCSCCRSWSTTSSPRTTISARALCCCRAPRARPRSGSHISCIRAAAG
jgi:Protein of unknown function (DUF2855)